MHIPGLELDLIANVAYVFVFTSFLMRDILWLRVFSVLATSIIVPYYLLQTEPLWPCIAWNIAFATINTYWIVRLTLERRPVHFTPDEQRLYDKAFRTLRPCHARKLFQAGAWKSVNLGEEIVTQGQPLNELSLISSGQVTVEKDGDIVDEIGEGRFLGSSNFLKGVKDLPASVTFATAAPSRLVVWPYDTLRDLIRDDTEFYTAIQASLGLELAHLLDHARSDLKIAQLFDRWTPPEAAAG